ncbi:MAG: hypothetical protein GY954_17015 [Alteromonas sp.]|nr:hypothetical protein [Alteromonas sp.]
MSESLEQESDRGQQARALIESPLWIEATVRLNQNLLDKLARHYDDIEACQLVAITKVIHDNYVSHFETIAEDGILADFEIAKQK